MIAPLMMAVPAAQTGRVDGLRRLQIHATETGQAVLNYSAVGLPPGLRINTVTGLISGRPARPARTTVTVTVRDGQGRARTATFAWTITGRPRGRASSVRGRHHGHVRHARGRRARGHAAGIKPAAGVSVSVVPASR